MRRRLIIGAFPSTLALIVALGASGCGKKATQQVAPPPAAAASDAPAQSAPHQSSPQPTALQNSEPDLANLNRALIRWLIHNKRRPASFEDFAATADTPIPPAPAGKKYIIAANMHVQLVNL
jgi:hypothetical protein